MTQVDPTIKVQSHSGFYLMWCTACGPMGVSEGRPDAIMVGNRHLEAHGSERGSLRE